MTKAKGKATRKTALFMTLAMAVPFAGPMGSAYAAEADAKAAEIADAYADEGYTLVWNDEFDGEELNMDEWNLEAHPKGWVNKELQVYGSPDNIEVSNDTLKIYPKAVKKEKAEGVVDVFDGNGIDGTWSGAGASISEGKATIDITSVGTDPWSTQFQKAGLTLEEGHKYKFTVKAKADEERMIALNVGRSYGDYASFGSNEFMIGTEETECIIEFTMGECDDEKAAAQVNLGNFSNFGENLSALTTVELWDATLIDLSASGSSATVFDEFDDTWSGAGASISEGKATIDITSVGTDPWSTQFQKGGLTLTEGHVYKFTLKASAAEERMIALNVGRSYGDYASFGSNEFMIGTTPAECSIQFTMGECDDAKAAAQVNLGNFSKFGDNLSALTTVTLTDVSLVDLTAQEAGGEEVADLKNDYDYTSGRISTQNKEDFVYGRFEASVRVPEGMGYLPAFWLMATDEDDYGEWPKCGEIDIMEVKGQDITKSYHTIHYGYDNDAGHRENQGTCVLDEGDFSSEFHKYTLDWEPGKLTWYVDDVEVYTTSDWFTGNDESSELTYPAPFDHEMYVILNLAIGGKWVGYPDQAAVDDMDNQLMEVDYVRVYQKDWSVYEEQEKTCVRPEKEQKERQPDENNNYVVNGNFAEELKPMDSEEDNFELHLENDCLNSTYEINDGVLKIIPEAEGGLNHSVQLKQTGIPMYRGYTYEISYDAWAEEERTIIVDVEGPDKGYTRYFDDTEVDLGTTLSHYTHTFTMTGKTDLNGSLEFNLGNQGSDAPVYISNVTLTHVSGELIPEDDSKVVTADGNYVYNGSFDQGEDRLGYWNVDAADPNATVEVSNTLDQDNVRTRELGVTVTVPETGLYTLPVAVSQFDLAAFTKGRYELSFDAYCEEGAADGLKAFVSGKQYLPELTDEITRYTYYLEFDENLDTEESFIFFWFYKPGIYHIDNVRIVEDALIKNGSFDAGLAGYACSRFEAGKAAFSVVEEEDGHETVLEAAIEDIGSQDWHVQIKSSATTLEKDKYYKLSFDAKSTVDRNITVCMQHDGSADDKWDTYSGAEKTYALNSDWNTFEKIFQMTAETDNLVLFSAALGLIDDEVGAHSVYFDNISLIEVEADGTPIPRPELSEEDDTDNFDRLPRLMWVEVEGGKYTYPDEKGELIKDAYIDRYYLDEDGFWTGTAKTVGWKKDADGHWTYVIKGDDCLKDTWKYIDLEWYYFNEDGCMEENAYRDGYYLAKGGALEGKKVPGWKKTSKGLWWYDLGSGKYLKSTWKMIDGDWYYFNAEGYMAQNEFVQGWWIGKDGIQKDPAKYGWHKAGKGWWYGNDTWYAKSSVKIDGVVCNFSKDGYWAN